uniref:Uncharacterized protein n=1 Tax=Lygus hesperus TaxID=30085 RepID=A0A0K8SWX3_LYGHE
MTPHERMFTHQRRSSNGETLPSWLVPHGKALMRRHIRQSKYDPLVDEVELIEVNPSYARVKLQDGRETTVSLKHLAPSGDTQVLEEGLEASEEEPPSSENQPSEPLTSPEDHQEQENSQHPATPRNHHQEPLQSPDIQPAPRRSSRIRRRRRDFI